jgi:hypothetical protein
VDCYLGLGVYHCRLARASTLAKIIARVVGLGGGSGLGVRVPAPREHGQ